MAEQKSIYEELPAFLEKQMRRDAETGNFPQVAFPDSGARRRDENRDKASLWRTPFIRDVDKILNCPFYNRYADKTQVFSLYRNDDLTRRALHVQLVSRIARTIGHALHLNNDLIEAIALGHDIGHTPFGHDGEAFLDELLFSHTGEHFCHNIHSVRVLDGIFPYNITLQTLNGIAAHDGEFEQAEYRPQPMESFEEFDEAVQACYQDRENVKKLMPSTLEGCVVRISDMIAYLGKDRQDAEKAQLSIGEFPDNGIGNFNAAIIHNLVVNLITNSYGKPYIRLDEEHFQALRKAKQDNYNRIYLNDSIKEIMQEKIRPMMGELYERLLQDLSEERKDSPVFRHHIAGVNAAHYRRSVPYEKIEPNRIVADYIASMTDDYFIDLYRLLFPDGKYSISYHGYFDRLEEE